MASMSSSSEQVKQTKYMLIFMTSKKAKNKGSWIKDTRQLLIGLILYFWYNAKVSWLFFIIDSWSVLTLTGCTKYLSDDNNKRVVNEKTGQNLRSYFHIFFQFVTFLVEFSSYFLVV